MSAVEMTEVEGTASVSYVCDDCGRAHNRNSPPCNDCGSMSLTATEDIATPTQEIDERESWRIVRDANRSITGLGVFATVVGALTLLAGASILVLGGVVYDVLVTGGWLIGIVLTVAGIVAIPAVRWRLERRLDVYLSSRTVLVLYLALVVGGFALGSVL